MTALRRFGLLLGLLALAVVGNHYNLSLFFGVHIIFGSVAVWLALAWLGLPAALLVAAASGLYTYVLWDHPYAILIFFAEALAVGGVDLLMRRRGREPPPLLWLVSLYWLLIGAPLVVLFYRYAIQMPVTQVVLIAIKQPLNGILNAAMAQLILLGIALVGRRSLALSLRQLLFSLLLTAMLLPVIGLMTWQNQNARANIEADLRDRLLWFAELARRELMHEDQTAEQLTELQEILAARLPDPKSPNITLLPATAQQAVTLVPSKVEGLLLRLPEQRYPAHMERWRAARYQVAIPMSAAATGDWLAIEVSTTLVIDQLHARIVRLLGALLTVIAFSALFAERLSTLLTRPLERLIETATAIPNRITAAQSLEPMKPAPVREIERLARAIERMGNQLAESFVKLQKERDALKLQRERYQLVIDNLEDLIVRTDRDGRLEFVSPSYCKLFGHCEEELLGQDILSPRLPKEPEAKRAIIEALRQPPYMHLSEHYVSTRRGWRWLQWVDRAVLDHNDAISSIVSLGRDITERKLAELDLIQREAIERELLEIATAFVLKRDEQLAELIDEVLEWVGLFTRSDRTYLFQLEARGTRLSNTHEWCGAGIEPMINHLQDLNADDFSALMQHMYCGEPVVVPRVADLGEDWAEERKILEFQGIQSVLLVPLMAGGTLSGFIGFDAVFAPRDWLATEVRFLQVVANLMVGAFDRSRIHQALVESQARYDQVARQSRSVAWEIDASGRYTYISPIIEDLIGYQPEQLVGKYYFYDLFPAAERERLKAVGMAYLARGRPCHDLVNVLQHSDGSLVWVNTNGLPIIDEQGKPQGYRGIDIDISARHRAEQQLRDSEARLSAIFNQAPIGIATADQQARITLANQAMGALVAGKPETLIGVQLETLTHPDDRAQERQLYQELISGQRSRYRITKRLLSTDAEVVWVDMRMVLIPQEEGQPPLPLAMFEDITEVQLETERRKQIEQDLAEYMRQLEKLVDLSSRSLAFDEEVPALLALGCDGLQMTGGELGQINGDIDYLSQAQHVAKDAQGLQPPTIGIDRELLTKSRTEPGIPQLISADQLPTHYHQAGWQSALLLALPWSTPDGQDETLALSFWSQQPISILSSLDRELIRLIGQRLVALLFKEHVQQVMIIAKERETIGHLASGIAHDFNNLLGVIDGNLRYLQSSLDQLPRHPEINEFSEIIDETLSALGHATVITSGMLSLSRAGGIRITPTLLEPAINELTRILEQVLPARIKLVLSIEPGISAVTNAAFLQSALLNLALNARDAMPDEGQLSIRARTRAWRGDQPLAAGQLPPGDYVELRVADTGCGMTNATLRRLFEPLFSTKAKQRGHGLGMFMVQEFVLRSGAGLAVESTPGQGSVFRLLLPSAQPAEDEPAARPQTAIAGQPEPELELDLESAPNLDLAREPERAREQMPQQAQEPRLKPQPEPPSEPLSEPGQVLEQVPGQVPSQVSEQEQAPEDNGQMRVLVVDDDPRVRETVCRLLRSIGVIAEDAEDAAACLQRLNLKPGFDLVLTDLAMPKMDGAELYAAIVARDPEQQVILMSGQDAAQFGVDQLTPKPLVLRKPIVLDQLRQALHGTSLA
ncbi:PAS domain S-box protein [Halochromatium roseum]|uniref:PAS domain S-box protein n=1 Tax=Halochromatium roseum TaxID=391920 RepID=UPI001912BC7B|nr:PAS domain S-box protein [Halochromatium roseum]